jgi:hypothetical protein
VAEDAAVVVAVEVLRGDQVGDLVEGVVIEQQAAQQRLLRLDRMRRHAQREQLRVVGLVAERFRLGHGLCNRTLAQKGLKDCFYRLRCKSNKAVDGDRLRPLRSCA